jgi:hypothetical protein
MKKITYSCDICGKNISDDFRYRFRTFHYRMGLHRNNDICSDCLRDFRRYVKEKRAAKEDNGDE